MSCIRCHDTGLIEYVDGEFQTVGNTLSGPRPITATVDRPVYRRCDCRDKTAPPPRENARETERFGE